MTKQAPQEQIARQRLLRRRFDARFSLTRCMNSFRTYVWNGRPVMSVSKSRWRLRWAASRQLQDYTWRRNAFKSLLQLSLLAGVDSTLGEDAPMPQLPGADMNSCLRHIARLLGKNHVDAVFTFPSQDDRKRIYATLFNPD